MKNILLIGPPGVGKGTQADYIVKRYNLNYVTTGNLLRKEVNACTELGNKISSVIQSGELVSDEIVEKLLLNELNVASNNGILFDGYPRNIQQVYSLDHMLKNLNKKLHLVINMHLSDDILIKRISGRFVCSKCSTVYNKFFVNPKNTGICDNCENNTFITRSDDNEEVIKKRLSIFHSENNAIVNYYREEGVLVDISCEGSVNEISHDLSKVIDDLKEKVRI